jgi:hypothetical protein
MSTGALSLFHNVSTYGGLFLNIKKNSLKIHLNQKIEEGNLSLLLVLLESPP